MAHHSLHELALIGLCCLLGLSACGSEAPQAAPGSEVAAGETPTIGSDPGRNAPGVAPVAVEQTAGSIELALKLGDKKLDAISYAIVGSGFATSGTLDISKSSKVSGIVGGIPFGRNYALTMTGKGVGDAPLDCSGSTSFDLQDVGPLPVSIQITCKEPAVTEPPPAPVPVPPLAVFSLACLLAAMGVAAQRRAARG
ncbi:MAG TPA: hypothetical protein VGJ91_00280 [Polyangiaceae bacterium]